MERYCVLDEKLYLNAEIYQWEVKETEPPFGIFMQMLHQYYNPIPITEQLRLLNGVDHVTCYWNGKKQQNTKHSNEPAENYTKEDANKLETFPKHKEIDIYFAARMKKLGTKNENEKMGKMDNPCEAILRDTLCKYSEYFYLDLCQALYYSLEYQRLKGSMVPLISGDNVLGIKEGWMRLKKKGQDKIRREKRKKVDAYSKLSDVGVDVPVDTDLRSGHNREILISAFGADFIRFLISSEKNEGIAKRTYGMLDYFSPKRKNRYTIEAYSEYMIKKYLEGFHTRFKEDEIINQMLLNQNFGLFIVGNICDFLEGLLSISDVTDKEIEECMRPQIDCFVKEIKKCRPFFSVLILLDAIYQIMNQYPYGKRIKSEKNIDIICEILKATSNVAADLTFHMNYIYDQFANYFYYGLYKKSGNKMDKTQELLRDEIMKYKQILGVKKSENNYETAEIRIFKNIDRRKFGALFPYIQKAYMIEC